MLGEYASLAWSPQCIPAALTPTAQCHTYTSAWAAHADKLTSLIVPCPSVPCTVCCVSCVCLCHAQIYPEVTCPGANLIVMMQVICSNLIDFIMLGLVFARFSAPFKRATSIRFSSTCTINRHSSGYWALTLRWVLRGGRQQQQQRQRQRRPGRSRAVSP